MGDKRPQPNGILAKRVRRIARSQEPAHDLRKTAFANTLWQAAGRLEDVGDVAAEMRHAAETAGQDPIGFWTRTVAVWAERLEGGSK